MDRQPRVYILYDSRTDGVPTQQNFSVHGAQVQEQLKISSDHSVMDIKILTRKTDQELQSEFGGFLLLR